MKRLVYEWDIETLAEGTGEDRDIEDHDHAICLDSYREDDVENALEKRFNTRLVLVCDHFDGTGDRISRSWAYVEDNKLPTYFSDASGETVRKVPRAYHRELKRKVDLL